MRYGDAKARLKILRDQIEGVRAEMRATLAEIEPETVADHVLENFAGPVRLSDLFGKKKDLIVIHNMGADCTYCTLWADGYNGLYPHIASRAAFVIASPDAPARQRQIAQDRGWRFPMVSDANSAFAANMGYVSADGRCRPGISVLQRTKSGLVRVEDVSSRPHDDFCAVWHLFDLLPGGAQSWRPRFSYGADD